MIRRIPVMLSILFSLLGIPFSFHGAEASAEQLLLDFGACEIRVVSVELHGRIDSDKGAIRPHDGNHRLTVVRLKFGSVIEGVLALTPGGFTIGLKVKEGDVYRIGVYNYDAIDTMVGLDGDLLGAVILGPRLSMGARI